MEGLDLNLPTKARTVACVTGAHGSGGPMVAQLLYRLGLDLGDGPLVAGPADPDAPWSHEAILRTNRNVLRSLGGDWDVPPETEPGRERDEGMRAHREEAARLLEGFRDAGAWGWEDPASSLTLPFWLDLVPDLKVVVCVRNPLEAADVLRERGVSSPAFGLSLWRTYNERLLRSLPEDRCVVTHHDAYLYRPQAEIRRILYALGMNAADQLISLVRSRVVRQDRYRFFPLEDLETFDPTGGLNDLYSGLCARAEWNPDPTASPARPARA